MQDFPIYRLDDELVQKYFGEIPQPPKQINVRGIFPADPHLIFLTVVGSRKFTPYGKQACEQLIAGLRGYPVVIVSGLAYGIDAISHQAALDAKLPTIAFPGSGLSESKITPRENFKLAEAILKAGGCLLSEEHNEMDSPKWIFPKRNRLMAGISKATLIIEATHKSGSRITTKFAYDYNRDIFAVPGRIFDEQSQAPNELIRMGAIPVTSSQEILEALGLQVSEIPPNDLFSQCEPDEERLIKLLGRARQRGDLIRELGLPAHKANILLSQMEIKGFIVEENGEIRRGP